MCGFHCSLADRDPIKNPGSMCNLYATTLCLKSWTTWHKMFPISPKKVLFSVYVQLYKLYVRPWSAVTLWCQKGVLVHPRLNTELKVSAEKLRQVDLKTVFQCLLCSSIVLQSEAQMSQGSVIKQNTFLKRGGPQFSYGAQMCPSNMRKSVSHPSIHLRMSDSIFPCCCHSDVSCHTDFTTSH